MTKEKQLAILNRLELRMQAIFGLQWTNNVEKFIINNNLTIIGQEWLEVIQFLTLEQIKNAFKKIKSSEKLYYPNIIEFKKLAMQKEAPKDIHEVYNILINSDRYENNFIKKFKNCRFTYLISKKINLTELQNQNKKNALSIIKKSYEQVLLNDFSLNWTDEELEKSHQKLIENKPTDKKQAIDKINSIKSMLFS